MEVQINCRHFPGDRPCRHHKISGTLCQACSHFAVPGHRVLVIKLDALGDVLRTTCLLPSLRRKHPDCQLTWLTSEPAAPVLANNPYIDEVLYSDSGGIARLHAESFDLVLNPDASKRSAALASLAVGDGKRGFDLRADGQVRPLNPEAVEWMELGARDDLKRSNRRTYQDHLHRICGLDPAGQHIVLRLTDGERAFARRFARFAGLSPGTRLIGFNTGAGRRWPKKRWPRERYLDLSAELQTSFDGRILLLGGPAERETNRWIAARSGGFAIEPGGDHSLREYFALVDLCDLVVTGDTLGLHAALALGKRVVALFGPTSPWEIDLYGRGERVVPEIECVCCYRGDCTRSPSCMDLISSGRVLDAIRRLLDRTEPAAARVDEKITVSVA